MTRRDRARFMASRRETGADTGRAATRPGKEGVAALQLALLDPRSSNGRTLALTVEKSRSESWPGNQNSESVGAVAVGAAATPDHNLGIGPRSMTVAGNIVDPLGFYQQCAASPPLVPDWARHEYSSSRQANRDRVSPHRRLLYSIR